MPGAFLLPLAGQGGPTKSGRMRVLQRKEDVARSGNLLHPTPLRGATFSREREKGRAHP